jgi:hypothetical protein
MCLAFGNGLRQLIFVCSLRRLVALHAAWLIHQSARMSFCHPMLLLRMIHRPTASLRA